MRQILPAIAMVILLCFAMQTFMNEARVNATNEERARHWEVSHAAARRARVQPVAPTTRPTTRPVRLEELTQLAK